jgi:hypothetical protein
VRKTDGIYLCPNIDNKKTRVADTESFDICKGE